MSSFKVEAITPSGIYFSKEVNELYLPSIQGPIGIFPDYAPGFIALKEAGILKIKEKNIETCYAIFGGVVKVMDNTVTILSDDIEDAQTIDMARAIASRDRANDRLEKNDPLIDEKRARASLLRALTRIEVKSQSLGSK